VRIGTLYDPALPNSRYRCIIPLRALAQRGHEIVWPQPGADQLARLRSCELVHMHRQHGQAAESLIAALRRAGVAITYDNDDDLAAIPRDSPSYQRLGGLSGHRDFAASARAARRAALVTTPSPALADRYRESGVRRVEVIENYLPAEFTAQERRRHHGVVVGWIAGLEHAVDAGRLGIPEVLLRLLNRYRKLRVAVIGHDLLLDHERYFHLERTGFATLLHSAAAFDIGIAPLADSPFNASRSNVKLKEYAALGVPWLASPVGPYADLGSDQGGRLVRDADWELAISELIEHPLRRRRLAQRARTWAKTQTIEEAAPRWEAVFEDALRRTRAEFAGNSRTTRAAS
jgi:glycosyltransferase involved in cell wall biosynthesis